jgi:hypothetical protein
MAKDNGATGPQLGTKPNIHRQQDAKVGRNEKCCFRPVQVPPRCTCPAAILWKREKSFLNSFSADHISKQVQSDARLFRLLSACICRNFFYFNFLN